MNIRIAICDDEAEICTTLENLLIEIFDAKEIDYEIEIYYSGEGLSKGLEYQFFDLLFLDIELKGKTGIEISRYIRDELKNEKLQIAFISSKTEYAMNLFEYRPINFIVKPFDYSKINQLINKFITITSQNKQDFEYKKKAELVKVPMSDILFFESKNRKISITTLEGTDGFYGLIEEVYQAVKEHQFLHIHKSIIVNYRRIKRISYDQVTMINGQILPISQSRRVAIKKMCLKLRKGE